VADRLALVTGASTGIGRSLAEELALRGYDLLLVADEEQVQDVARQLTNGIAAHAVVADLTEPGGVRAVSEAWQDLGRVPAVAALNAGRGASGRFDQIPLEADLEVVELNVVSTVHLAKLVLPPMVEAGEGHVLVTSSIAATAPGPFHATYAASKAFLHSFAEALREELHDAGVSVTSLLPGPTDTEFFARADMGDTAVATGPKDDPDRVARVALDALFAGKDHVVAGSRKISTQAVAGRLLPERLKAKAQRRQAEPGTGQD